MIWIMNKLMVNDLPEEETCWQAVVERDSRYDGVFYFGVRSTGIYCRPVCPARRPRRDQVTFFASRIEAQAAGFRPCKRCRPDDEAPEGRALLVEQARRLLDQAESPLALADLARQVGASPSHLQRVFKAEVGLTPRAYFANRRLERLKTQLKTGQDVTTALYEAGFGSSSRLYEDARQTLGMTPGEYRNGGKGLQIRYTTFDSRLGRVLMAATRHGVCKVSFGGNDSDLEAQLAAEFPEAERARDDAALSAWSGELAAYLQGSRAQRNTNLNDIPLDAQGTAFQHKVWAALRQIPYGQTRTYAQLAQSIDQPAAVRAAARACATNPVAVVTPCHRVVRSDGSLGGYRWGLERKKQLLESEKKGYEYGA
jgi:AraC family transcriptional regulator of adaptative response/methylated-DNA-[protein]-cysteine methyltransferase